MSGDDFKEEEMDSNEIFMSYLKDSSSFLIQEIDAQILMSKPQRTADYDFYKNIFEACLERFEDSIKDDEND